MLVMGVYLCHHHWWRVVVVIATAAVAVVGPAAAAAALLVVAPPLPPSAHGAAAMAVVVPDGVLPRGAALAVHLGVVHLEVDRLKETVLCSAGVCTSECVKERVRIAFETRLK